MLCSRFCAASKAYAKAILAFILGSADTCAVCSVNISCLSLQGGAKITEASQIFQELSEKYSGTVCEQLLLLDLPSLF